MALKERAPDPRRLDLLRFCQQGTRLEGEWPQATLERLSAGLEQLPGDQLPPAVAWSAQGEARPVAGAEPELWLQLRAETRVVLLCQRCLQPYVQTLLLDRRLRFVKGDDEAARLDEESEDDVLALSARTDLQALLEDELILALPLVPRHGVCPEPLLPDLDGAQPEAADGPAAAVPTPDKAPHPFAALAALRKPRDD
jgi:uncharacterized protein